MDAHAGNPHTPSYTYDPSAAAAATKPIAGSFGFVSVGAPSSTGITCGLFMPPQMTSTAGGIVLAPAVKPRAPFSKLPNVVRPKKGKEESSSDDESEEEEEEDEGEDEA
ncbi:hypothetical protein D1007_58624 [Hordeum vulgare]|nr:hypothetical protein D1007_58624 [Hordeum vulgare]